MVLFRCSRYARLLASGVLASVLFSLVPRDARADELEVESDTTASLLVGAGIAALSVGVGLTITSNTGNGLTKNAGILVAQSGLVAAPFAAHAVVGEWTRGAVFALPPLAAEGGMLGLVDYWKARLVTGSSLKSQYIYSGLFTLSVLSAAVGIIDALGARARAARRAPPPSLLHPDITPAVDGTSCGIRISGFL